MRVVASDGQTKQPINLDFWASQAPDWSGGCPVHLDNKRTQAPLAGTPAPHVGQVVGSNVHAAITGAQRDDTERCRYDALTRSYAEMVRQTDWMSRRAREWLDEEQGRTRDKVIAAEDPMERQIQDHSGDVILRVVSRPDLVMGPGDALPKRVVDIKTGKNKPVRCWPQLAVTCFLWSVNGKPDIESAGYLWIPRGNSETPPVYESRPYDDLRKIGASLVRARLHATHTLVYKPSILTCPGCALKESCALAAV